MAYVRLRIDEVKIFRSCYEEGRNGRVVCYGKIKELGR